ncbi:hypothetical protein EC991_004963 [Linnemannia zychae]|nr:hypothetical protein EC991_004963 [Linnemannia zychae]
MLGGVRDPEQLVLMWMQEAIQQLHNRNEQRDVSLLKRTSNLLRTERMTMFHRVKEDKDHMDKIRPTVNTHLHILAQDVNDDVAQDAHVKHQLQWRKSKNSTTTPAAAVASTEISSTTASETAISTATTSNTFTPMLTSEIDVLLDVSTVPIATIIIGYKLYKPFKQLQIQAAATVNDLSEKVSVPNLPLFMYFINKRLALAFLLTSVH